MIVILGLFVEFSTKNQEGVVVHINVITRETFVIEGSSVTRFVT